MNNHIQIGDVTPRIQYAADGSQAQFSYPFPIFVEDDLEVYTGDTKEISGYSVLGAGTSDGGSVTFDTPPASGVVVTLRRSLAIDRTTDFQQSGAFRAKDINDELDYLTAALQQVADDAGRAVRLSSTDEDADLELPSKDERANKVLGFDASGDVIATSGSGGTGGGVTDHGQLTGLSDDDHNQYHNDARGDARYYTQGQIDTTLAGKSDTTHNHDAAYAAITHVNDTDNPHGVTKYHVGLDNVENIKINLSASVDPSQNDDVDDGYTVGSRWINTAVDREFVCVDSALGAAVWIETTQTGGGGVSDHGSLTGLGDDDHAQYHTNSRGDARYYTQAALDTGQLDGRYYTETEVDASFAALGSAGALDAGTAVDDVVQLEDVGGTPGLPAVDGSQLTGLPSGVSDHGALTGLSDDDHSQYHNDTRGDARYYTQTALDTGQLDGRYYTETEVDASFAALGSAAALDAGTAVDDVVQLEDVGGTPGLPAVDGSQLTGLPSGGGGGLTVLDDHTTTDALTLTTNSKRTATAVPASTTLPASGSDHQIEFANRSGSAITVDPVGSDTLNVNGTTGQTSVDVPDNSTALFHINSTRTEWHVQIVAPDGEANTLASAGSGVSLVAPTPKVGTALQARGLASPDNSVTIAQDNPNSNVDLTVNIAGLTEKATPVDGDWALIADSTASNALKKAQLSSLPGGGGGGSGNITATTQAITDTTNSDADTFTTLTGGTVSVSSGKTYEIEWRLAVEGTDVSVGADTGFQFRRADGGGLAYSTLSNILWANMNPTETAFRADTNTGYEHDNSGKTYGPTNGIDFYSSYGMKMLIVVTTGGTIGLEFAPENDNEEVKVVGANSVVIIKSWDT